MVGIPHMEYPDGYGAQYDKLLHLTVEPVNGGVENGYSYSQ